MKTRRRDDNTPDLFEDVFPVRAPKISTASPVDLSLKLKSALGRALKECPDSAEVIALRMTELGTEITGDALYALTAPSKGDHQISAVRLVTFVMATGATWLFDLLVADLGLVLMEGREAKLAELGLAKQNEDQARQRRLDLEKQLRAQPVRVDRRRAPR